MRNLFFVRTRARRGVVDISFLEQLIRATEDSSTFDECKLTGTVLFSHTNASGLTVTITYVFSMNNDPKAAKNTNVTDLKRDN